MGFPEKVTRVEILPEEELSGQVDGCCSQADPRAPGMSWNKPTLNRKPKLQSVQFSHSVVSNSLEPHESQHARPPCPSPTPGACSNSCNAIQPSHPLSSPSPPAPSPSQHQGLFQ